MSDSDMRDYRRRDLPRMSLRSSGLHPLSAPPRGEAVGHAGVGGAVRQAWMGVIAAEGKVRVPRIVERPAALALRELEQGAALRAFDRRQCDGRRVADARCLRIDEVQRNALWKRPRAPVAWRALAR